MMKRIITLLTLLLSINAIAQNVGIGTNAPTHKLTVAENDGSTGVGVFSNAALVDLQEFTLIKA